MGTGQSESEDVFVSLLVEAVNRERETTEVSSSPTATATLGATTPSSSTTSPTHSAIPLPEGWAMQVKLFLVCQEVEAACPNLITLDR